MKIGNCMVKIEEIKVAFCEINQYYVVNCPQSVKHSSADVCNRLWWGLLFGIRKYSVSY